jgi:hypothetical protein
VRDADAGTAAAEVTGVTVDVVGGGDRTEAPVGADACAGSSASTTPRPNSSHPSASPSARSAVEHHLAPGGARSTQAPSTLAFVACLAQLVPLVSIVVSPFLWGAFMSGVDTVQAEAERLDPEARSPATRGAWRVFALIVAGTIAEWVVLIATFLAVWQFLNPPRP